MLSQALDTDDQRACRARPAVYRSAGSASKCPCDECLAVQHETRDAGARRTRARELRVRGELVLRLCPEHAEEWRARDRYDIGA